MSIESIRQSCMSMPYATEDIQWENDLLFRVGNRIFTVVSLEPTSSQKVSFKCTPAIFGDLVEREGIIPAPYMARNHWVSLERWDAMRPEELQKHIAESYQLIYTKLTKKLRQELENKVHRRRPKSR